MPWLSFPPCQIKGFHLHPVRCHNESFNLLFHLQLLNDCTTCHSNNKADHHISDCNFCRKDTHQQNKDSLKVQIKQCYGGGIDDKIR